MVRGRCKLCERNDQILQDGHMMPAGMYRRVLDEGSKNAHPVVITERGSHQTSRQVRDFVFCSGCEKRFDTHGENYALRVAGNGDCFPLMQMLEAVRPSFEKREWRGYNCIDTPVVDRDKLTYFGLSVFWRAAVHTWRSVEKNGKPLRIMLGRKNCEQIRRYLLGETGPPAGVSLFFVVVTDRLSRRSFYLPTLNRKANFRWIFGFAACGLFYHLTLGKSLGREQTSTCLFNSPERWIWMRDGEGKVIEALGSIIAKQPPDRRLK